MRISKKIIKGIIMNIESVNNNLFAQISAQQLLEQAAQANNEPAQTITGTNCGCVTNTSC